VVDAGHKAGIEVAMCGEMAGDPMNTVVLLAMKIDEMSMYPLAIPRVKRIIRAASLQDANILLKKIMPLAAATEVRKIVEEYMHHHFSKMLFTG
jgi:phosphotransferase system enzyme I (PtsI)